VLPVVGKTSEQRGVFLSMAGAQCYPRSFTIVHRHIAFYYDDLSVSGNVEF
jgi:hypothetical protein